MTALLSVHDGSSLLVQSLPQGHTLSKLANWSDIHAMAIYGPPEIASLLQFDGRTLLVVVEVVVVMVGQLLDKLHVPPLRVQNFSKEY